DYDTAYLRIYCCRNGAHQSRGFQHADFFDDSAYLADRDDASGGDGRFIAGGWFIDAVTRGRIFIHHMACRKNLPNRYSDVWQKGELPRIVEVDPTPQLIIPVR